MGEVAGAGDAGEVDVAGRGHADRHRRGRWSLERDGLAALEAVVGLVDGPPDVPVLVELADVAAVHEYVEDAGVGAVGVAALDLAEVEAGVDLDVEAGPKALGVGREGDERGVLLEGLPARDRYAVHVWLTDDPLRQPPDVRVGAASGRPQRLADAARAGERAPLDPDADAAS